VSGGGAPSDPILTALWTTDPGEAASRVRAALEKAPSVTTAAVLLNLPPRTLYRWIREKPELRLTRPIMTPRELRGAVNRAKTIYAVVFYNPRNFFYTKVSKSAAKELAETASEGEAREDKDIVAREQDGDLYIGTPPATAPNAKAQDEEE
jgi:hypothetical protein